MKKIVILLAAALSMTAAPALAGDVGFGINLNLGFPFPVTTFAPAPVFVTPPDFGFSVAVGVPYDMVFTGNRYYVNQGDRWYCGPRPNGPWRLIGRQYLPQHIRSRSIDQIRSVRYAGYRGCEQERSRQRDQEPPRGYQREARRHDHGDGWSGSRDGYGRDSDRRRHDDRD